MTPVARCSTSGVVTLVRDHAVWLAVFLAACSGQPVKVDAGVSIDAGVHDAGALDAGRDAGLVDAGATDAGVPDAGVHPCFFCPSGAFCESDGGCDYACGACQDDTDCGPRHQCWSGRFCVAYQPDCSDVTPITGVRIEIEWCSSLGSIPLCQRVLELPLDGGLATLRQEPIGAGDGGTFTVRLTPASSLISSLMDAGLTCVDQPRLDQLNPSCITHSGGANIIVFTSTGVRRLSWGGSASIRPPRAVDSVISEAANLLFDTLADAGVR